MKSKSKKRILALVLSMVLMLSTGISAMAEGEAANGKTDGTTAEKTEPAAENQEVQEGSGETPDGEKPEELREVAEVQTQTDGSQESGTEEIISEAADLYQDFQDENGNVITTIHAYVPEGAFQAKADQITMQAKLLDQESDDYIKGMIEEKLPENSYLGGYVLYEVNFMVDGVITEPAKAITLTIEGSGLSVTDLSRTKAFRYDPADPDADGDKDELVEMGQKADVLTYLAENGIGEDQLSTYEYSELDVQEEIAHQIGFNTWKSTIYGCYTEAYSAEYTFSQEVNGAAVNVTAPEGAFPTAVENVSFAAAAVTEEQDTLIQEQLAAKAEGLGQEVKGYQAYDLSFAIGGEEVQPQVPVTVSFENTGLSTEEANGTQNFQLDEEAGAVNDLEGSADDGTAAMTLSQMGTVGYWAYGDAAADEDGSKDDADADDKVIPGDDTETPTETPTDTPDDPEQDQTDVEIEDDTEEDSNLTDDSEDQIQEDGEEDKTEEGDLEDDADEADETDKEDVTEKEDAELAEDADALKEEKENQEDKDTEKEDAKEKETGEELTYEDDSVVVTVSAEKEGVIPEGAKLQVVPLLADDKETKAQYQEVEEKLQEKAEDEDYEIAGFLAYDISFVDEDGEEVEPDGEVKVSLDYKEAAVPEDISEKDIKDMQISMMHLEENENGEVKDVVDMGKSQKVDALETTEEKKVQKVEVRTESFSYYTLIWYVGWNEKDQVEIHYIDEEGNSLDDLVDNEGYLGDRLQESGTDTVISLSDEKYAVSIEGYEYIKSTVANAGTDDKQNATSIYRLRLYETAGWFGNSSYKIQYNTKPDGNKNGWTDIADNENVYMVYRKTSSGEVPGGDIEEGTLGAPDHNKYIKKNSEDNYTLTLDVTGERGAATDVDILLILDESGSMGNDNRIPNVNSAIEQLITQLNTTDFKENIRLAVVGFSGTTDKGKYNDASIRRDWTSLTKFEAYNAIYGDKSGNGKGTNWQAGIRLGETLDWRADANKYVIFMTDGDPTYYYDTNGITAGEGNEYDRIAFNKAVNEWKNSSRLGADTTTKYVVDITNSNRPSNNQCDEFAEAVGATELDGNDSNNLTASFKKIADSITRPSYKGVYIQDTLSEYVDFADPLDLQVNKITEGAYGSENVVELVEGEDYTIEQGGKTIKINLLKGAELEENTRYEVNYDVIVTEDAYTEYAEEGGYNSKGDEETDHLSVPVEDRTSSGKEGFRSNESAIVGYTENGKNPQTSQYKHPVVQINPEEIDIPEEPNPIEGSITKTMGNAENGQYPITLEVKTRLEKTSEAADVDVIFVIDTSSSMNNSKRIDQTKAAAETFVKNFIGAEGTTSQKRRIGIVTFGTNANAVNYGRSWESEYFSNDSSEIIEAIEDITVKNSQGTNTYAGLKKAQEIVDEDHYTYVILLTDGVPTYHHDAGEQTAGGGSYSKKEDFNKAVDAAVALKEKVDGIYTIGFLNGYKENSIEMDVARRLLASDSEEHHVEGYTDVYKMASSSANWSGSFDEVKWDKSETIHYSDGYFEITAKDDPETELADIWKQLATIINNHEYGSTGSGWEVTDTMDEHVAFATFSALEGAEINGYTLHVSENGTKLTATQGQGSKPVAVAMYDKQSETITWILNDVLAEKSIRYNKGVDYTYSLTYYVDLKDSGKTEFRNTNETTYVTKKEDGKKIYPEKMPFYINIIGNKKDISTQDALSGAKFSIYLDENCSQPLAENITTDQNGHFAFQIGQSDMTKGEGTENYSLTVYIKETEAPENYILDTMTHPLTIQANGVTYTKEGVAEVREFKVTYTSTNENDMVSWNEDGLFINYNNGKELISIPVVKKWVDGSYTDNRQSVNFKLYQKAPGNKEWTETESRLTLTANDADKENPNIWRGSFNGLDPYFEYQIQEELTGSLYIPADSGIANAENEYTITNVLAWDIIKHSSTGQEILLNGAEFTLSTRKDNEDTVVYTGVSGSDGVIQWKDQNSKVINPTNLKDGTYILKETKAPTGYSLSKEEWSIVIENGFPTAITCGKNPISGTVTETGIKFYFEDDPLYSLPSAGGSGIFLYMIGGTLLLIAGSLMIYINRRKGVLRK